MGRGRAAAVSWVHWEGNEEGSNKGEEEKNAVRRGGSASEDKGVRRFYTSDYFQFCTACAV